LGLTVIKGAPETAERFAQFVLSSAGQKILIGYGFAGQKREVNCHEAQRTQRIAITRSGDRLAKVQAGELH
jgi:ABC-type Fe3+ transport system substrate-binding protein